MLYKQWLDDLNELDECAPLCFDQKYNVRVKKWHIEWKNGIELMTLNEQFYKKQHATISNFAFVHYL